MFTNTKGESLTPVLAMLPHRPSCASCGSIATNADSLVQGMELFGQGRGGGESGRMVLDQNSALSVRGQLLFGGLHAKDFFCLFAGVKIFIKMSS